MIPLELQHALSSIPAGPWAVGVSGGADSVALLSLLREHGRLQLHVVHLDHETRGEASRCDAEFVAELARQWGLPATLARLSEIQPALADPPPNPSAFYRAARLALFRRVIEAHRLGGVILAHHADDQAETVLHRLIRGSGYTGLAGMSPQAMVNGIEVRRPLLGVDRGALRGHLLERGIAWREDASNESDAYLRNRLRKVLAGAPGLRAAVLELAPACAGLRDWARGAAPVLPERFRASLLSRLPDLLANESAREWLTARGTAPDAVDPATIERLVLMARDAATPARQDYPGGVSVRRRQGTIEAARQIPAVNQPAG